MNTPSKFNGPLLLALGLVLGGVAVYFFNDSLPGAPGSPQEHANDLELELKKAHQRIAALEATAGGQPKARGLFTDGFKTVADGTRNIAEDLRAGRPVSPDDIFRATQPLIRDLAPLLDRMRLASQKRLIDARSGELARKYDLTAAQQAKLREYFELQAAEQSDKWNAMISSDETRFEDVVRATNQPVLDRGLDQVMAEMLPSDKLASFQSDRLDERMKQIQQQADGKVQRLDAMVQLDEQQRDQVFGIMARSSPDYDASMQLEGARGTIAATPSGDPEQAMLSVLRPGQRAAYDAARKERREKAEKEAAAIGLKLPENWEALEDGF